MARRTVVGTLALLAAATLHAQAPLDHVPESRLRQMSKGVMLIGWHPHAPHAFLTQQDLDFLRQSGFTHGRVYVDWRRWLDTGLNSAEWIEQSLAGLVTFAHLLTSNGLGAVICIFDDANDPSIARPGGVDRFDELWRTVATRLRESDPDLVFFEILNEPGKGLTEETWEAMQRRFVATIRAAAPAHTIVATSADYSAIKTFVTMNPLEDRNVVYAFHLYPSGLGQFILQGLDLGDPVLLRVSGLPYPSYLPEVEQFLEDCADPEVREYAQRYADERWWGGHIDRIIRLTAAWRQHHGRPVILGEYALGTRAAPLESRQRYNWDVRQAVERYGIGWLAWSYAQDAGFSSLMVTEGGVRTPDPLLMAALGLWPWSGPSIPPPDFTFDGPDQLSGAPVAPVGTGCATAAALQLDADVFPDLVATPARYPSAGGEPVVFMKNYFGGAIADQTASFVEGDPVTTVNCHRIVTSDLNADGRPDLLFADYGFAPEGAQNRFLLSAPGGRWVDASANLPQELVLTTSADAADTRGNGRVDVVLLKDEGLHVRARMQLLANDGSGRFTLDNGRLPASLTDTARYDNIFADGRFVRNAGAALPDLVLIGWGAIPSVYLRNDGTGRFTIGPTLPPKPFGGKANEVAMVTADLNKDGAVDLVVGYLDDHWAGGCVQVLMGNGDGTFRDETSSRITQPDLSTGLQSLAFSPATAKSPAYLLIGTGGGRWFLKALSSRHRFVDEEGAVFGDVYGPPLLVDFNADGLTDIVTPDTASAMYGVERVVHHPLRRRLN